MKAVCNFRNTYGKARLTDKEAFLLRLLAIQKEVDDLVAELRRA